VRKVLTVVAATALLAAPATALAACPQTTVADLEDEIMCPVCGTSLATAGDAPLAVQQRRLIDGLVNQCRSKEQIKDALVAQYGESVLAEPKKEGFGVTTYLVPGLAIAAGLGAVLVAWIRWRRRGPGKAALAPGAPAPGSAADAKLDADMERYDL
jgi:cytochrome c-type biogenesis protein CcmH/NrfF